MSALATTIEAHGDVGAKHYPDILLDAGFVLWKASRNTIDSMPSAGDVGCNAAVGILKALNKVSNQSPLFQ